MTKTQRAIQQKADKQMQLLNAVTTEAHRSALIDRNAQLMLENQELRQALRALGLSLPPAVFRKALRQAKVLLAKEAKS